MKASSPAIKSRGLERIRGLESNQGGNVPGGYVPFLPLKSGQ